MPEQAASVNQMDLFRIYPSAESNEFICTTVAEGPVEALELTKTVSCVECFMTSTAWAERAS